MLELASGGLPSTVQTFFALSMQHQATQIVYHPRHSVKCRPLADPRMQVAPQPSRDATSMVAREQRGGVGNQTGPLLEHPAEEYRKSGYLSKHPATAGLSRGVLVGALEEVDGMSKHESGICNIINGGKDAMS